MCRLCLLYSDFREYFILVCVRVKHALLIKVIILTIIYKTT